MADLDRDEFQVIASRTPDIRAQLQHLAEVVVGRRTPEVGCRRLGEQALALVLVAGQATVLEIDAAFHVAALESERFLVFLHFQVAVGCDLTFEVLAVREPDLL